MSFRILGLDPTPFVPLYGLSDTELTRHGARRTRVTACPGYPDRVALEDAAPGEDVLLVNYVHQPADTPYRASHAIYVREGALETALVDDDIPAMLERRLLSIRAFDAGHMMVDADVVEGVAARATIERLLADPQVAYLQAHFAKRGCYAARIERLGRV